MDLDPAGAARERYRRVQAAMARRDVGALLLATPHLAAFASGARRVQVAGSGGTVPWVVVCRDAPAARIFTTDPDGAPPWMPRTAVEPLRWDREEQLARIADLVRPTGGAIACDVFSAAVGRLAEAAGRRLVDAAPLLAEAAAPRSDGEVALVVRAVGAARNGLRAAMGGVAPERPVAALVSPFAAAMARAGAGFPLSEGLVWRAGPTFVRLDAAAVVDADDVLALEFGLWVGGHAGVAGDTVGATGDRLLAKRRAWEAALAAVAERCRAGATVADVAAAAAAAGAASEGPLAHGLGVGIEPPLVGAPGDAAAPLAAGTVLVLAPVVEGFRATRALVVTEGAPRWLEASP
jgi:Xaa-Pro aminopeptidase